MERGFDPAAHEEIPWKKKNKMKNKRRFTDEQIRLLESIFESDTKLEPRMKLQIARELGLQPRQVAIWFQNRRARWKSKRIEQDYKTLRTDYEKLATRFESLKKEKQSLISQLQKLRELAPEPYDINKANKGLDGENNKANKGLDGENNKANEGLDGENNKANEGHDGETTKCEPEVEVSPSFQQAPLEFVSVDEYRNESPTSPEKFYGFDSADKIFDHSCSNPQWLNFWIRGEE